MTVDRRALAGVLATLLLVAACGGSATQVPGATQAPGATQTPTEAPGATEAPTETQEPTDTQGPDVSLAPGAAGDLEALLPSEAGGIKFEKVSFDGASIPGALPIGEGDDFTKFLADNGKSLGDVRMALASPVDPTAAGSMVMALQVKGAPSDKMLAWVTQDSADAEKTTVGGKQVYGSGAAGFGAYFYVKGDIVFYVLSMGGDPSLAEEVFKQLP
ncbi:MAG: hypothetical protein V2B17_03415 [Chloroflexota bacterium]